LASIRMGKKIFGLIVFQIYLSLVSCSEAEEREGKALSVFNVVKFPNTACGASNGFNGTCYTSSECSSLGGTASGTCASSFGVCCVFSIACGASSSANNSYAIISSYSTSTDSDPCTYTFCPVNTDVCKLRIDFDTMVLTAPGGISSTAAATDSMTIGDCIYDSLTVSNPGGAVPPTICGYNTGQHMFVPASTQCNQINIDIDTLTTTTTRKWQIKVTQYECGNMMAPEQDCLQYHTASSGTIASFNWDTSATSVSSSQYHLSDQYYDICIRRARSYCSVCYSPQITSTTAASSFGVSAAANPIHNAIGSLCTGITTLNPAVASNSGFGDYLDIVALQPSTGTTGTLNINRICGTIFNAKTAPQTSGATACSWAVPFKVGVHFDADDAINAPPAPAYNLVENDVTGTAAAPTGAGYGYSGFYLAYWQNTC